MYCGTGFQITGNIPKETEIPERLVPFITSRKDFEQAALEMLVNADYAPNNIFDLISFKDVEGIYLPMFFYEGKYESSWTCLVKEQKDTTNSSNNPVQDTKRGYRPLNGLVKDDYNFICLAYDGIEVQAELAEYVRTFHYNTDNSKSFHPDDLNGYFFLIRNLDQLQTWHKWGEDTLQHLAQKQCMLQVQGADFKDFKNNIASESHQPGKFVFFPVWVVYYEYDGEPHHIMMDGTGKTGVKGTTLVDRSRIAQVEKPFKALKFIAVAAILLPLILLVCGLYLPAIIALAEMWLLFFGYRYYARMHRKRIIRKARKERKKIYEQRISTL